MLTLRNGLALKSKYGVEASQFGSKFISMAEPSSHCPCRPESGFVWEETQLEAAGVAGPGAGEPRGWFFKEWGVRLLGKKRLLCLAAS